MKFSKILVIIAILTISISCSSNLSKNNRSTNNSSIGSSIIDLDRIIIYPGDKLFVEAKIVNNKVESFKIVNSIVDSDNTISISFSENKSFGKMLSVHNPFNVQLKYKAKMKLTNRSSYIETSIIPVGAKIDGMEMWSDPIESLILSDFELIKN